MEIDKEIDKKMFVKYIAIAIVFCVLYFANTQAAKADIELTSNVNSEVILKTANTIENRNMASRGAIGKGSEVVSYAYKFIGKPYVYGATGPNAFDCSGLTQYVYNKFGVNISRTTYTQVQEGTKVDKNNLMAGDLVFFSTEGSISHVGIYIGEGKFIHAPRRGKPVMVSSLTDGYYAQRYATARRIFT